MSLGLCIWDVFTYKHVTRKNKNSAVQSRHTERLSSQSSEENAWPHAMQIDNVILKLEWMKSMLLVWSCSSICQLHNFSAFWLHFGVFLPQSLFTLEDSQTVNWLNSKWRNFTYYSMEHNLLRRVRLRFGKAKSFFLSDAARLRRL